MVQFWHTSVCHLSALTSSETWEVEGLFYTAVFGRILVWFWHIHSMTRQVYARQTQKVEQLLSALGFSELP